MVPVLLHSPMSCSLMDTADLYRITKILQRETPEIAARAAGDLMVRLDTDSPESVILTRTDAEAVLCDHFVRLGGVLAMAVLVDEPDLVVDELKWLQHFHPRSFEPPANYRSLLTSTYMRACTSLLSSDELAVLADLVQRVDGAG